MGENAQLCIFQHKMRVPEKTPVLSSRVLVNQSSMLCFRRKNLTEVHQEHKNRTSAEINKMTQNYEFFWNVGEETANLIRIMSESTLSSE